MSFPRQDIRQSTRRSLEIGITTIVRHFKSAATQGYLNKHNLLLSHPVMFNQSKHQSHNADDETAAIFPYF